MKSAIAILVNWAAEERYRQWTMEPCLEFFGLRIRLSDGDYRINQLITDEALVDIGDDIILSTVDYMIHAIAEKKQEAAAA